MTTRPPFLVFSDLDGTLLDHASYSWAPAAPALARLREIGAGVILASSKTAAEIAALRADMGLADWPAIVENGGGLLEPGSGALGDTATYRKLRAALEGQPPGFRGFGDMTDTEVADLTGLTAQAAARARTRQFSEPGLWTGPEAALDAFLSAARAAGLTAQQGGRFLTLSFGGTKADRMDALIERYRPLRTVALGDAPNDTDMLMRADHGIIVKNPASPGLPPLPGEATGRIRRTALPGPEGWAEAMISLLDDFQTTKEQVSHG